MSVERAAVIAADGARSSALVAAARPRGRAVVVVLPAMGVPAAYYEPLATALAGRGLDVVVAESRGTGTSDRVGGEGPDFGYHVMTTLDVPAVLALARDRFPERPLHLLGHSLGGQIGALFAATHPGAVDSLALVACGSVDYRGYPGASSLRVLAGTQMAAAIAGALGYFPGHKLGFGGRQPRGVIRDWARLARTGEFRPDGATADLERALAELELDVLAVSIAGDTLSPEGTTDRLCAKLARARVRRRFVELDREKGDPHFRWARRPGPVLDAIESFLDRDEAPLSEIAT